jgi:hypothetical protein
LGHIESPTRRVTQIFTVIAVLGIVAGIGGLMISSGTGVAVGIIGLVVGVTCGIVAPILHVTGKKQIREIQALLAGENLLAHWTFDQDEWGRYTQNEHDRGLNQAKKTALWTFVIALGVMVLISLFAGALTSPVVWLVILGVAVFFTVIFGGLLYIGAQSNYATNRRGAGEVYIGQTAVYFGTRLHTWKGAYTSLRKVLFELGDPSVVEFQYRVGTGDNASLQEVRIPVPRGRETEAQEVANSFSAAS